MTDNYLNTLIGRSLVETLDLKVRQRIITPKQAQFVLAKFYEAVPNVFNSSVISTMNFKAKIVSYNFVDGVWKFIVADFAMSINNKVYRANYLRIIAKDSEVNTEVTRKRKKKI